MELDFVYKARGERCCRQLKCNRLYDAVQERLYDLHLRKLR